MRKNVWQRLPKLLKCHFKNIDKFGLWLINFSNIDGKISVWQQCGNWQVFKQLFEKCQFGNIVETG